MGDAIVSLTDELRMAREHRIAESSKKPKQVQAVEVLERSYTGRLEQSAFIDALGLMEDPGKARVFLTLKNRENRDLWLEQTVTTSLLY